MKKFFSVIVFSFFSAYLHSQGIIKSFDTEDFPVVSLCVQSFNPDTIAKENIHIFEEGKNVELLDCEIIKTSSETEKCNVLFIWDLRGKDRLVLELLNDYLKGQEIVSSQNKSLKLNVAVFRRDENKQMIWKPLLSSFTNDIDDLWQKVIAEGEKELQDFSSSMDIHWILNQAINLISTQPVDEAKAIFLFSVGSIDSGFDSTSLVNIAKEKRIQLFFINIDGDEQTENIIRNMSMQTYGTSFRMSTNKAFIENTKRREACSKDGNGNPIKDSTHPFLFYESEYIYTLINTLPARWDGQTYRLSYVSQYERIGQTKQLRIELGQDTVTGPFEVPGFSMVVWIKSHVLWFIVILLLSLTFAGIGLFYTIRHIRNRIEDKKEKAEAREAERQKLKSEQETLRRKLESVENERREKYEQEQFKDKNKKRQDFLSSINSIMKDKNIKLRLLISSMTGTSEYIIDEAEISLGTAEDNKVVIEDTTVSRHHALIYFNGENFCIRDLNSTNGVVINGFKVSELKLRNGDSLSLGRTKIKVYF